MMEREYIVTAKSYEDLESLYNDLENISECDCIPNREVECVNRRPISRNTHYKLTEEEALLVKSDERVLGIELTPEEKGVEIIPYYTIGTSWDKGSTDSDTHRNWGMYRCINGATVSNWGSDITTNQNGTVLVTSSGKNVDVVIVDGCFDPAHPEFAVNEAGTGGSRVNQFNWFSLNTAVGNGANGTYVYTPYTTGSTQQQADNNHGCHVAGTVAGNRRGWAREANIYNINPYGSATSSISSSLLIDYIRAWHNSKTVNAATGRKNPTITNHSYGIAYNLAITSVQYVKYRGTQYNSPSAAQLTSFGLLNNGTNILLIPYASTAMSADITDAVNDGIIFVGAAGNSGFKIDAPGGVDYDNVLKSTTSSVEDYYHRGSSPTFNQEMICVGNIEATSTEQKRTTSNCGARIDVYAPGSNIISSVHSSQTGGTTDSRNSSYKIVKYNGTSMASPQVAGVLACLAEQFPRLTQYEAKQYLGFGNTWNTYPLSKQNQLSDPGKTAYTYTVTNSGASSYTFSGSATGSNPSISVTEGSILTFNVNATGHPFWIKTAQTTGTTDSVITGTITNNGTQSGSIVWDTRGVTPGTYYYICQFHSAMVGTITITGDYSGTQRSLQGSKNNYLFYQQVRKVPNPTGTTYIGGQSTSQITYPRDNKFRSIKYDVNSSLQPGNQQYMVDDDIYASGFVYPRRPIWHRSLT